MARLKRIVLPEDSKFLRRLPASKLDDPDFVKAFDQHTLFYDTFYDAETGLIILLYLKLSFGEWQSSGRLLKRRSGTPFTTCCWRRRRR